MEKKDNLFKDLIILIVYISLWVALVAGFFMDGLDGLKISFFSFVVLFIWNSIDYNKYKAEKEVVDIIIKNTDFNLKNIEDFLFEPHEDVISNLNEIIDNPKNEFRKSRMESLRNQYIYSIPITYEANLHIRPNYKNLFDAYHRNPHFKYPYPKIENNEYFIYGSNLEDNEKKYKEKPHPKVTIIGNIVNFDNYFVQCFINGKYSKYEDFYIDFEENGHMEEESMDNRVSIKIEEENIMLDLFRNFFDESRFELYNTYQFPFKSIVKEFKHNFFLFNRWSEGSEDFNSGFFQEYNKHMVKKFSDNFQEKLSRYNLKYDIDETLDWYNLGKNLQPYSKLPDTKLFDLKILELDLKTNNKFNNAKLFDIHVKHHVFTHEFYTVYFDIALYLNK
jgi:hypothetical protein